MGGRDMLKQTIGSEGGGEVCEEWKGEGQGDGDGREDGEREMDRRGGTEVRVR